MVLTSPADVISRDSVVVVSCDITGHGREDRLVQMARLIGLNDLVRGAISGNRETRIWASGGDGGHFAITGDFGPSTVLEYLQHLRHWSQTAEVPLRVALHVGPVDIIQGAIDYPQLVGAAINEAGGMLELGVTGHNLVSESFRDWLLAYGTGTGMTLSPGFGVSYTKYGRPIRLYTLEIEERTPADWATVVPNRGARLRAAIEAEDAWGALYWLKRYMQTHSQPDEAKREYNRIPKEQFSSPGDSQSTLVLLSMGTGGIYDLVAGSTLIELTNGEYLVQRNENDDSMFLIIRGELGVLIPNDDGTEDPVEIRYRPGSLVGELAFGLGRPRTASLQSVGRSAVLAVKPDVIDFIAHTPNGSRIIGSIQQLVQIRALEHVCRQLPFLARGDEEAPLADLRNPWETLENDSELIEIPPNREIDLFSPEMQSDGIYLLVGGSMFDTRTPEGQGRLILDSSDLPVVFIRQPGEFVDGWLQLTSAGNRSARLLRIGLRYLTDDDRTAVVKRLLSLRSLPFDVFIGYDSNDASSHAQRLREYLESNGLRVFMQSTDPAKATSNDPFDDLLRYAISQSNSFVAVLSPHLRAKWNQSWLASEIAYRRAVYPPSQNIFYVETVAGLASQLKVNFQTYSVVDEHLLDQLRRCSAPFAIQVPEELPPLGSTET